MASISIRSTYAFDQKTVDNIKTLAKKWGVSQSEAVRRSVQMASNQSVSSFEGMTPLEALQHCFDHPTAAAEEVAVRQREAYAIRKSWPDPGERGKK